MSATPLFYGRVDKHAKLLPQDPLAHGRQLHELRNTDVEYTIRKRRTQRSLKQNAVYWALHVKAISEFTGYEPEEVHELLKARFLPKTITLADQHGEVKEEVTIGRSTTKLSATDFQTYLRRVEQFAAELGCYIPDPQSVSA